MKLENESTRDALAAEYVLGTLQGAPRRRFEKYLKDDQALRAHVEAWQERLQPLLGNVAPVSPSPAVWQGLAHRLGFSETRAESARWWSWRPALAGFAVLLLVATLFLGEPIRQDWLFLPDVEVAFVDANQQPLWRVQADSGNDKLVVTALGDVAVDPGKAMELWLLRDNDQAPVSLGLLPVTNGDVITVRAPTAIQTGTGFAVSLEPTGGSPTGLPTGPVLYVQSLGA